MNDTAETAPYEDLETETAVDDLMQPGSGPAVIDFWSPTCGPCMAMAQDFEHVAAQFDRDELRFYKINTATHGHLAAPFNIRSVPTLLFIHDGQILDAVVGRMTAQALGTKAEWLLQRASRKPGWLQRLFGRRNEG